MKLLVVLFGIIFLTYACGDRDDHHSEVILKEYLKNADSIIKLNKKNQYFFKQDANIYKVDITYYSNKALLSIKGSLLHKSYGCGFYFFSNGNLSDFIYNVGDDKHNSYNIKYRHKSYIEEGTPLVDYWPMECKGEKDSIQCRLLHFSTSFPAECPLPQFRADVSLRWPCVLRGLGANL